MNKNFVVIVVVALIALLGAGGYLVLSKKPAEPVTSTNNAAAEVPIENTVSQDKILKDLLSLSGNQKCTFKDEETDKISTFYATNGQLRGYFEGRASGQQHLFSDGSDIHIWMDGEPTGFKMSLDTALQLSDTLFPASNEKNTLNDFNCGTWSPDNSIFEVPQNVAFTDPSNLMLNTTLPSGGVGDSPQVSCRACDSFTGEAQSQCRTALGC